MKTAFRVLVILIAAVVIGGLIYRGVNSAGASSNFSGFGGDGQRFEEGSGFRPDGDAGGSRPEEGRGGRGEGGFGFPGGILKALVLMSVAGGVYSLIVWGGRTARKSFAP